MALTVAGLAGHIITRRRFYALVLEADIELLRGVYGESVVEEALRLADGQRSQSKHHKRRAPSMWRRLPMLSAA